MIHVSILALKNCLVASVADARLVFVQINNFLKQAGKKPMFQVSVTGTTKEIILDEGLFTIHADVLISEVKSTDLIIIPALAGDAVSATYLNKEYVNWIINKYKGGSEIASLSTGAFILAYSGLLKGKQCTTHASYANEFRYYYPSVIMVDEKVITDQQGLYSSGGSNAYWNLLIHLVEKFAGREMAILAAKHFVIDLDRNIQSPFIIFNGVKDHDDELIRNSQNHIEKNYAEKLTVDQIAEKFSIGRRTFERRFKKATRYTVAEYIQRVRIEAAKKLLEIGRKTVNEVMNDVGYADIQTFRDVFNKLTGMTPVNYYQKYNSRNING